MKGQITSVINIKTRCVLTTLSYDRKKLCTWIKWIRGNDILSRKSVRKGHDMLSRWIDGLRMSCILNSLGL